MKVALVFCGALLAVYAVMGLFIIPSYVGLYEGFGDDMPGLTQLVLASYHYWFVMPIFPAILLGLMSSKLGKGGAVRKVLNVFTVSTLAFTIFFIPLLLVAAYLPIFKLGAAVIE